MKNLIGISALAAALVLPACAHKPMHTVADLNVVEKITINAPVAAVWAKAHNFGDLGAWHPAVAKTEIVNGDNNKPGAVRLLTLQDGGTIEETLTAYDANRRTYSYVINKGVLPVSNYASTITVNPLGADATEVTWAGNFKRKDLAAKPAENQDDATATKTIQSVYQGGLANLKKITE